MLKRVITQAIALIVIFAMSLIIIKADDLSTVSLSENTVIEDETVLDKDTVTVYELNGFELTLNANLKANGKSLVIKGPGKLKVDTTIDVTSGSITVEDVEITSTVTLFKGNTGSVIEINRSVINGVEDLIDRGKSTEGLSIAISDTVISGVTSILNEVADDKQLITYTNLSANVDISSTDKASISLEKDDNTFYYVGSKLENDEYIIANIADLSDVYTLYLTYGSLNLDELPDGLKFSKKDNFSLKVKGHEIPNHNDVHHVINKGAIEITDDIEIDIINNALFESYDIEKEPIVYKSDNVNVDISEDYKKMNISVSDYNEGYYIVIYDLEVKSRSLGVPKLLVMGEVYKKVTPQTPEPEDTPESDETPTPEPSPTPKPTPTPEIPPKVIIPPTDCR